VQDSIHLVRSRSWPYNKNLVGCASVKALLHKAIFLVTELSCGFVVPLENKLHKN